MILPFIPFFLKKKVQNQEDTRHNHAEKNEQENQLTKEKYTGEIYLSHLFSWAYIFMARNYKLLVTNVLLKFLCRLRDFNAL